MPKVCVIIPVGAGRADNLLACLQSIQNSQVCPERVVLVLDGPEADPGPIEGGRFAIDAIKVPKHHPGKEQPRNIGVRFVEENYPEFTHVWFLDTDLLVDPTGFQEVVTAVERYPDAVMPCPYDWMGPGQRDLLPELKNDPRWEMFMEHDLSVEFREDLSAGLACFSGNLIWPIEAFTRVGGFWNELHHGRCEDGELGLRAVAMGVPIRVNRAVRGYHLYHEFDLALVAERNARDVPMLNARHPWVQGSGLLVVEEDGARFDVCCPYCAEQLNTGLWWTHAKECASFALPSHQPQPEAQPEAQPDWPYGE